MRAACLSILEIQKPQQKQKTGRSFFQIKANHKIAHFGEARERERKRERERERGKWHGCRRSEGKDDEGRRETKAGRRRAKMKTKKEDDENEQVLAPSVSTPPLLSTAPPPVALRPAFDLSSLL